jgi:small subunit ribosomal protein S16
MPTKIRLQRHGKKGYAFFHVVVADSRAPRDGKFIEKLGVYNPNTNPATIDIDFDRSLYWVKTGAQPTDTCRALLSYKGVLHKDHLDRGVLKGALTQEQADKKFEAWLADKEGKIQGKKDMLSKSKEELEKAKLKAEQEAKDKKAAEIAAKNTPEPVAEEEAPAESAEAAAEETPAAEEKTEEIAAEAKEEAPAEEDKKED